MSRYRLSQDAQRDLIEIRNSITEHSPNAAVDFIDRLISRFELLSHRPFMGRSRDDLRPGIRSSLLGEYLILYRPTPISVEIVRVIHGRRDLIRIV